MDDFLWGLKMTGVGMGVVFALLALLMGVLVLVARLDDKPAPALATPEPEPELEPAPATSTAPVVEMLTGGLSVTEAAAVALAVITHAEVRRREAAPAMRTFAPGSQIHTSRWVAVGRASQNQTWNRR